MKRRKRREITVETSLLLIRRGTNQVPVWCNKCSSPVQLITPGDAACWQMSACGPFTAGWKPSKSISLKRQSNRP